MKLIFLSAAQSEFEEAIAYYDQQRFGLGLEFATDVEQAVERITNYPEAWSPISSRVRRCLVKRFPYGIIYEARRDRLIIAAMQNLQRKPKNWQSGLR